MQDVLLGKLPDPFVLADGGRVKTKEDWERRRLELLRDAVGLEYGGMPPVPESVSLERLHTPLRGRKNSYRIHIGEGKRTFSFLLHADMPNGDGPFPVLITGDACYECVGDEAVAEAERRGFMVIRFDRTELAPDIYNSDRSSGIYPLYPAYPFSAVSAWAWGYHRVVDVLPDIPFADTGSVAVTGHSRGGKAVLLAGATDERIRFVNPNGSGAHGCGCYRYEQREDDGERSERLADLVRAVPYWLGPDMKSFAGRETELAHDMHLIKALIAPRYLFETNGTGDIWANPRGSYYSYRAAKRVWDFLGEGAAAVHYRDGGHGHTMADITAFLDFIDDILRGEKPEDVIPAGYEAIPTDFGF